MSTPCHEVLVLGGGIVGLATAFALTRRGTNSVLVLEAEPQLAAHQTGHNSGVIHSGLYYKPGSLKARNCTTGREAMYAFCQEHGIPHERCGKVVVATEPRELPALDELERRGRANGLDGLQRLGVKELAQHEPHAHGIAGLFVPQTGIVDYRQVSAKLAELIQQAGGSIQLQARVTGVRNGAGELVVETTAGAFAGRRLVNCTGLQADRVARLCGVNPGLQIVPFRGEYYQLTLQRRSLVRNLIYPVPDPRFPFLGVHFTRRISGEVEAGPNAVLAFRREGYGRLSFSPGDVLSLACYRGFWRMGWKYWQTGLAEQWRSLNKLAFVLALQKLVPDVRASDLVPAGSGVRAQAVEPDGSLVDDFRIVQTERTVHVLNAPSPAATASLTIGEEIANRLA